MGDGANEWHSSIWLHWEGINLPVAQEQSGQSYEFCADIYSMQNSGRVSESGKGHVKELLWGVFLP